MCSLFSDTIKISHTATHSTKMADIHSSRSDARQENSHGDARRQNGRHTCMAVFYKTNKVPFAKNTATTTGISVVLCRQRTPQRWPTYRTCWRILRRCFKAVMLVCDHCLALAISFKPNTHTHTHKHVHIHTQTFGIWFWIEARVTFCVNRWPFSSPPRQTSHCAQVK